jgi:hypothetical protein
MVTYPAAALLVSAGPPTVSDDFAVIRAPLNNGLPYFIDLTKVLRLKLTLPTGLMRPWLDADPTALATTSDDELRPRSSADAAAKPALRLSIIRSGTALATIPATLGAQRRLPAAGDPAQGAALDIVLLGWSIFAGTMQGPGDFGSFVQFGWKTADQAQSAFGPPVINPFLQRRLLPRLKLQSQLGLVKPIVDRRFAVRRWALDVRV